MIQLSQIRNFSIVAHIDHGKSTLADRLIQFTGAVASREMKDQTLANVYQAIDAGLEIVPILNKIDLPAAEPDRVKQQIEDVIGLDASEAVPISAKTGLNIDQVLEAIVHRLPPPKGTLDAPLKAL